MTDLSSLGATSAAVWTRRAALALLTPGEVDGLVRRGEWQVVWPGTYADGGFVLDARQRASAAVLACGGGAASLVDGDGVRLHAVAAGRTAARVWQLPLVDDDDPATGAHEDRLEEVAVWTRARDLRGPGDRLLRRRRLRLRRGDVRSLDGLWLTSPARTLYDLAAVLAPEALVCAVDAALHRGLVTGFDLDVVAGERTDRRFAAARRLADARAESPGETLTRLLLQPVLPGLVPQVPVVQQARVLARFDLADEARRLAVEFDGRAGHAGHVMLAKDRRRDARTAALGWRTERVTWFDVRRRPDETRQRVLATAAVGVAA